MADDKTQRIQRAPGAEAADPGGNLARYIVIIGSIIVIIVGLIWFLFLRSDGGPEDFTAVDEQAQALQQACFDGGLWYDQFGNCYSVDPASIREEDRPQFVVAAGTTDVVLGGATAAEGTSAGGSTGPSNPSSSGGNSGPSNPSSSGGNSGPSNPSSSGGNTTTQPTTTTSSPTAVPSTTPTTQPTAQPTTPAAGAIVATSSDEWVFRMSPTKPDGEDCQIPDGGGLNDLSEGCQHYQAAYSGSSSFQCDHGANGAFSCPTQNDANRDNTISGQVTRSSIALTRNSPGSTFDMRGSSVADGSTPGEVCDISGSYTQNFSMNGQAASQPGTYTGSRNAPGC